MNEPPARFWWARRTGAIVRAAASPWVVSLALLGAAGLAFPPWQGSPGGRGPRAVYPAGPTVNVIDGRWPHPRGVSVGWAFREWPTRFIGWKAWKPPSLGTMTVETGFDPVPRGAGGFTRPPGATVDHVAFLVSLWWLLGPPAAWSAIAAWRAVRTEPRSVSRDRRLARPWLAAFALVGAALVASGFEIRHAAGPNRTTFEAGAARTPAGSWHPRTVSLAVVTRAGPAAAGASAISARGLDVGFWWLVAAAGAVNAATVLRHRRGAADPAG